MLRDVYLLFMPLLVFCLTSCIHNESSSMHSANEKKFTSVGAVVPFVKQKDEFCGPAALASVLQFYGQNIDQDEIAEEIYIEELSGALISDMENFARDSGYNVESSNGSLEAIKIRIDNGQPVILLVDRGKWKVSVPHYYVVYGYNEQDGTLLLHTGFKEGQQIGYDELDAEWKKMNRLMLVITK